MNLSSGKTGCHHVEVRRLGPDAVEVTWEAETADFGCSIHVSRNPNHFDRQNAIRVKGETGARLSGLDPDCRHYFEILSDSGQRVVTALRRVDLERSVNFRDLGGYENSEGRRTKWGQVFRSDSLARLTERDRSCLGRLGLRLVVDFRSRTEVAREPDRLPDHHVPEYVNLPIQTSALNYVAALEQARHGENPEGTADRMIADYIKNIDAFADQWRTFFQYMAQVAKRPMVFHCTGGKDRAGTGAALVLLALDVPEETVIEDHQLSNVYIADLWPKVRQRLENSGIDSGKMKPYFTAPREAMTALLEHLYKAYGSPMNYLRAEVGVSDETLSRLRSELLE